VLEISRVENHFAPELLIPDALQSKEPKNFPPALISMTPSKLQAWNPQTSEGGRSSK
jgi:hypothetical protein